MAGEINHIEFPADDVERAKRFYGAVAGWTFTEMEGFPDYWLFQAGPEGFGGAIGKRGVSTGIAVRDYIVVNSLDDALTKVEPNGGHIVTPKTDIGQGWYAAVTDSEGSEIGLYEAKPRA